MHGRCLARRGRPGAAGMAGPAGEEWRGRPLFGTGPSPAEVPGLLLRGSLPGERLTLRERLRSTLQTGGGEAGWFGGHSFYLLRSLV